MLTPNLFEFLKDYCKKFKKKIDSSKENALLKSMNFLKNKAKTLEDIYQNAQYILNEVVKIKSEDIKLLDDFSKKILKDYKNLNKPSLIILQYTFNNDVLGDYLFPQYKVKNNILTTNKYLDNICKGTIRYKEENKFWDNLKYNLNSTVGR